MLTLMGGCGAPIRGGCPYQPNPPAPPVKPTSALTTALLGMVGTLSPSPVCWMVVSCCRKSTALLARRSSLLCAQSGTCGGGGQMRAGPGAASLHARLAPHHTSLRAMDASVQEVQAHIAQAPPLLV